MRRTIPFLCVFFLCCLFSHLSAKIRAIHRLDEIPIHEFSTKTLVMFDIDDVLVSTKDALLQNWRSEWTPKGVRALTPEEDTIAWMNTQYRILDPYGPSLIKHLNERGVSTIGFTSFAMQDPTIVQSIADLRVKHLQELGIYFKIEKEVIFSALAPPGTIPPSFERGVLYCGDAFAKNKHNKGKVLGIYLDWLDWTPEQVVFIDDRQINIEAVKKELDKRGIPYLGLIYVGEDLDPIDEDVATLQFDMLIHHKRWISDEEARALLLNKNHDDSNEPAAAAA